LMQSRRLRERLDVLGRVDDRSAIRVDAHADAPVATPGSCSAVAVLVGHCLLPSTNPITSAPTIIAIDNRPVSQFEIFNVRTSLLNNVTSSFNALMVTASDVPASFSSSRALRES